MLEHPPIGATWEQVLAHHVEIHGSWPAMADALLRAMRLNGLEPPELDTAVKGLRRLALRGQQPGGQYGRWVLRSLGAPPDLEARVRWLAQYHSRFADLPTTVRRDHLRAWDRAPLSESVLIVWIHVGLASIAHRRKELEHCAERLEAARRAAVAAGPLARLEVGLLDARRASDDGDADRAHTILDRLESLLDEATPLAEQQAYRARLVGQRAFLWTHSSRDLDALARARAAFATLPHDADLPFVAYRRTAGLAYTTWRLGDVDQARRLAREAAEHAADGGFVRFRSMALNLLARMSEPREAQQLRARAHRLARQVEDVHLSEVSARYLG